MRPILKKKMVFKVILPLKKRILKDYKYIIFNKVHISNIIENKFSISEDLKSFVEKMEEFKTVDLDTKDLIIYSFLKKMKKKHLNNILMQCSY